MCRALRFKQMCETLLLDDPLDYGLKVIDLLWRKAAYDPIQIFKRDRQSYDEATTVDIQIKYRMHLSSVFGFYSNLLIKFVSMLKPYRNLQDFFDFIPPVTDQRRTSDRITIEFVHSLVSV